MVDKFIELKVSGGSEIAKRLIDLAPELRRGPARRALKKGADPVLARAIEETPRLSSDVYVRGKLVRRAGTLRRSLAIRNAKDVNRSGDVGVFINIRPLQNGAVADFKAATGRRSSQNPDDPFYWRWVHFATKRNKNPKPFLTRAAAAVLTTQSLALIGDYLKAYFTRLDSKAGAK